MIQDKLRHSIPQHIQRFVFKNMCSVIVLILLASCGSTASKSAEQPPSQADVLAFIEESEQKTLRYLEEATKERMRIEEIYRANKMLIEQYIAEQKKTQQACKKETGNLAPSRIRRISPVQPLSEKQIEELNKATAAAALDITSGKPRSGSWGNSRFGELENKSAVVNEPPTPIIDIDPPYSPSDAP